MSACTLASNSSLQEPLSPEELSLANRLVELTQAGLPLVEDPWQWLADQLNAQQPSLNLTANSCLALLQKLQATGAIRRIAAVPNHYRLGYKFNGMTVWDITDDQLDTLGQQVGALSFVSHCYRRPRREGWPYNLFAMVHGTSQAEIDQLRQEIRQLLGSASRADAMLVSSKILKKTGLRIKPKEAKL